MSDVEPRFDGVLRAEHLMDVHYLAPDEIPSGAQTPDSVDSDRWQHPLYHKQQFVMPTQWTHFSPNDLGGKEQRRPSSWADLSEGSTTAGTPANNLSRSGTEESGSETSPGEEAYATEWMTPATPQAGPQGSPQLQPHPQASAEEMAILAGVIQENAVDAARAAVKMRKYQECHGGSPWASYAAAAGSDLGFGDVELLNGGCPASDISYGDMETNGSEIAFGDMEIGAKRPGADIGFMDFDMLGSQQPYLWVSDDGCGGADMSATYLSADDQAQMPQQQCLIPCILTPVGPPVKLSQAFKNAMREQGQVMESGSCVGASSMAHGQDNLWWHYDESQSDAQAWNGGDDSVAYFPLDSSNDCWNLLDQVNVSDNGDHKFGHASKDLANNTATETLGGEGSPKKGNARGVASSSWNPSWADAQDEKAKKRCHRHSHFSVPKGTKFGLESEDTITTMMFRKIPNRYQSHTLAEELNTLGFKNKIDFVYVPMDQATHWNVGYGFVNFTTPEAAEEAARFLTGRKLSKACNAKHERELELVPAHMQGLRKNLEHYRRSAVQFNKNFRPLIIPEALDYLDETEKNNILDEFGHLVASRAA